MRQKSILIFVIASLFAFNSCKEENQLPTCEIISPSDASEYVVGDEITISVEAEDADGEIALVEIFINGTKVATVLSSPFTYEWDTDGEVSGIHTLVALAWDNNDEGTSNEVSISLIEGYGVPCPETPTVTDIDGNTYNTILIGSQCWMQKNLIVTKYPNGDNIPYIADDEEWSALEHNKTDDAYCYYDNNANGEYGALYSYAAAIADDWQSDNTEGQGICPTDWHLPTDQVWTNLEEYLIANGYNWDGSASENKTGKSLASTSGWHESSIQGEVGNDQASNNTTGFNAVSGGHRSSRNGLYSRAGEDGYWWSATEGDSTDVWSRRLHYGYANLHRHNYNMSRGFSVRCIRD